VDGKKKARTAFNNKKREISNERKEKQLTEGERISDRKGAENSFNYHRTRNKSNFRTGIPQ
jgi:hypothetical protein